MPKIKKKRVGYKIDMTPMVDVAMLFRDLRVSVVNRPSFLLLRPCPPELASFRRIRVCDLAGTRGVPPRQRLQGRRFGLRLREHSGGRP